MTPARADSIAYYAVRESYINGIPPAVVFGVMLTENSRFISGAMSNVGAVGLMQVYPEDLAQGAEREVRQGSRDRFNELEIRHLHPEAVHQVGLGQASRRATSSKGLLRYNGCVHGSNTPNCKTYPNKVKTFVEQQAEAICGDKSFYDCIAKPFIAGLMGRQRTPAPPATQ